MRVVQHTQPDWTLVIQRIFLIFIWLQNIEPKYSLNFFEGWGDVDNDRDNNNFPSLLLEVGVPIISLKHCQQLFENWKQTNYKGRIFGGNICAGAPLKDSCTVSFISIFLWQKCVKFSKS